ncbi:helix-turn-helix domain-containing protein [Arenibacter sp. S6351L]|uniref:helix-turn-helix domain-containing protein n=1 Tax=Arenibacter sp. S6351L TaxID=2926407 RepID=UPI001FF0DFCD|nr:helix-turn-helix domain-containing protein [Arenibacter sp. S6351L]MCK0133008.1 helix-turn-helix domain-containing protein [Arenibacter sp. S6351L]
MDNIFILERLDRLERLLTAHKEVLTFEETCDYTGISRSYLYKLTSSGNIPHSKPNGKLIFFEKKKLNDWLLQNSILSPGYIENNTKRDTSKNSSSC